MAWVKRKVAQCDNEDCKHAWIPVSANPIHCPKCSSRTWNRSVVPVKSKGRPKGSKNIKKTVDNMNSFV